MTLPAADDQILILHNPRCSKSRAGVEFLESSGVSFVQRRYLEDPLSMEEFRDLRERLGRPAIEWTRVKEAEFKAAGLTKESSDEDIFRAMVSHPKLMERPIAICGPRAVLGRPTEAIESLL